MNEISAGDFVRTADGTGRVIAVMFRDDGDEPTATIKMLDGQFAGVMTIHAV